MYSPEEVGESSSSTNIRQRTPAHRDGSYRTNLTNLSQSNVLPVGPRKRVPNPRYINDDNIEAAILPPAIRRRSNVPLPAAAQPQLALPNANVQQNPTDAAMMDVVDDNNDAAPAVAAPAVAAPPLTLLQMNEARNELRNVLEMAGNGVQPQLPLHELPAMKIAMEQFVNDAYELQLHFCEECKEVSFDKLSKRKRKLDGSVPTHVNGICEQCWADWSKNQTVKFGLLNDFDPFLPPNNAAAAEYALLPKLSELEEMLIALHQPIMKIYRLKGGAFGFAGNVVNLVQNVDEVIHQLPRTLANVNMIVVRKQTGDQPTDYRDFKVNKNHIVQWLRFLKDHNQYYRNITIDELTLDNLPNTPAEVYNQLRDLSEENDDEPNAPPPSQQQHDNNPASAGQPINIDIEQQHHNADDDDDYGQHEGPIEQPQGDNILQTGYARPTDSLRQDEHIEIDIIGPLQYPNRDPTPIDEFNTPGLFAKTFPTKFPFGRGDPTDQDRLRQVTINEAIKHFNRYAIPMVDQDGIRTGGYTRPFDQDPRFSHYIQDVDERHRIHSQASYYIKSHPSDGNQSFDHMKNLQPHEIAALNNKISRYASNILGSPAYFSKRRKELQSLIEQQGTPTLWWTLSYADHHWQDLHRHFGKVPDDCENNPENKSKWLYQQCLNNPSLVNEYFTKRVAAFVTHFFGQYGLEMEWSWYRYEWQMRGSIHVHGMVRLKSDPDMVILSSQVIEGRQQARKLAAYMDNNPHLFPNVMEQDKSNLAQYTDEYPHDVYMLNNEQYREQQNTLTFHNFNLEHVNNIIEEGLAAEKRIITYRDYVLSSMNRRNIFDLPQDATLDQRLPSVLQNPHPSSVCHDITEQEQIRQNRAHGIPSDFSKYCSLADVTMRHRCTIHYCIRNGKCRFRFPRTLTPSTVIKIEEKAYGNDHPMKGTLRKVAIDLIPATNDRWLNGHCIAGMMAWGGNCDFNLLLDRDAIINYIAKYGTKNEENSTGCLAIFSHVLRKATPNESSSDTMIRSWFIKATGGREKTQQETAHLSLSETMVTSSCSFTNVNLNVRSKQISIVDENENDGDVANNNNNAADVANANGDGPNNTRSNVTQIKNSIVTLYSKRTDYNMWFVKHEIFAQHLPALPAMPLDIFVRSYFARKNKIVPYDALQLKRVIVYTPEFSSKSTSTNYPSYCYFNLMKYKPWDDEPETTYGGIAGGYETDIKTKVRQDVIVAAWREFLDQFDNDEQHPDYLQRKIDMLRDREENLQWTALDDMVEGLDIDLNGAMNNDFTELCRTTLLSCRGQEAVDGCEWDRNHDWHTTSKVYSLEETQFLLSKEALNLKWENVIREVDGIGGPQPRQILPQQLRGKQIFAFNVANYLLENANLPNRHMILVGKAGCGKSFVIDALRTKFQERLLLMAPSGKAAAAIDGLTIHSLLRIPVGTGTMTELQGDTLKTLQAYFTEVIGIIMDEYSMSSQKMLSFIDRRLREAKPANSHLPFGGLFVMLCGDPGQLPPVGGTVLWENKLTAGNLGAEQRAGRGLYLQIRYAIKLQGSNRLKIDDQKPFFEGVLNGVRNGKVTEEQFRYLNAFTREPGIVQRYMNDPVNPLTRQQATERFQQRFQSNEATYFYNTNEEILKHNLQQLQKTGQPICRVSADHNCSKAQSGSEEQARRLPVRSYFSVNSKVLLTWNLNVRLKLVNGTTGLVKDIVFAPNATVDKTLPVAIVVEVPLYSGGELGRFFSDITDPETGAIIEDRSRWVPFKPSTAQWYTTGNVTLERTMFPLSLAWAWTPWKGQGSTCDGPCVIFPGKMEKSTGLLYVVLSRATTLYDVHIPHGISYERMTLEVTKKPGTKKRKQEEKRLKELVTYTETCFPQFREPGHNDNEDDSDDSDNDDEGEEE